MQLCNGERRKEREKREGIKKSEIQLPWNKAVPRSPVWGSAESLSAVFELQAKMALGSSRDSGRGYISPGRSCRPACGVRTVKEVSRVLVFTTREKERKFLEVLLSLPPLEIGRTFPIFTIRFKFDTGFLYWSFCNSLYHGPENEVGDTAHALFFCCFSLSTESKMKLSVLLCLAVVLAVAVALPAPLTAVGLAPVGEYSACSPGFFAFQMYVPDRIGLKWSILSLNPASFGIFYLIFWYANIFN